MVLVELLCCGVALAALLVSSFVILLRTQDSSQRPASPSTFAFFHPYCSGGGGGERVLWKMVQLLQGKNKRCVIYTIDPPDVDESQLRADAERRFDVKVPAPVHLVSLSEHKGLLKPQPFLSLIMESVGTMRLAYHALAKFDDIDVFLDTTGCAFTFWVVRLWWLPVVGMASGRSSNDGSNYDNNDGNYNGSKENATDAHGSSVSPWIVPYVHYPTISMDMMAWEANAHPDRAKWKTAMKLHYYRLFAAMYGWVGRSADLVMVNSTWTYNHINSLWNDDGNDTLVQEEAEAEDFSSTSTSNVHHHGDSSSPSGASPSLHMLRSGRIKIVYPPCRVPKPNPQLVSSTREPSIVSIGQFRPEKDHKLQVLALHHLLKTVSKEQHNKDDERIPERIQQVKLILIGSCRNEGDRGRVEELKALVNDCSLQDHVEFRINPPYDDLKKCIESSSIGVHTMRQEHFGIGIVEMMAAGLLVVAHNSGGPKTDIVHPGKTGFLATTVEEYGDAFLKALAMSPDNEKKMRHDAQESAQRFSDEIFDESMANAMRVLIEEEDDDEE
mmetsp:Transcript_12101/g.35077  ORF Transcript_12101/g.35077 Transcript_12101/m.35077 type:complete len:555 (-) Transcript_12101:78-1742(-)